MRDWLFVSRECARTGLSKREVLAEVGEYEDCSEGCPSGEWLYEVRGGLFRYLIRFSADPPEYEVVCERYVAWFWLLACFVVYSGLVVFDGVLLRLLSVAGFLGVFCAVFLRGGPLTGFFEGAEGSSGAEVVPVIVLLVVLFVGVVFEGFVGWSWHLGLVFSLVSHGGYWLFEDWVVGFSEGWQGWIVERSEELPRVVVEYPVFLLMVFAPVLVFDVVSFSPWFLRVLSGSTAVLVAFGLVFSVGWCLMIWASYWDAHRYTREAYASGGQTGSRVQGLCFAGFSVLVSLGVGVLCAVFLWRVGVLFSVDAVAGVVVGLLCGWPVVFGVFGLLYQVVRVFVLVVGLLVRGERREDVGESVDIEPDVYVVDGGSSRIGAASVGFYDFVFVGDRVVEALDGDLLDAALAHEEGHVVNGDSRLAFVTGVFSPFVLTGKNVLFSALGFERREMAADRYAKGKVGDADQVVRMLRAMDELKTSAVVGGMTGAIPTAVSFGGAGSVVAGLEKVFGFFYGDFGVTQAHPSIEDREEHLRDM